MKLVFRVWREIAILLAVALAIYSWYIDARGEFLDSGLIVRFTILWGTIPVLVGLIYVASALSTKDHAVNFGNAARVLIVYNLVGFYYAANGISDPNTAGHMHVLIVPILLGAPMLLAVLAMFVTLVRARRNKSTGGHAPSLGS